MTVKNDTKIEEELTCRFKIDMTSQILTRALERSKKFFVLISSLWPKYILFELQKYRGVIFHDTEELCNLVLTSGMTLCRPRYYNLLTEEK